MFLLITKMRAGRLVALEVISLHLDVGLATGAIPIAAVENFALVERDLLAQAVRLDVSDEHAELVAHHQWE